MRHAQQQEQQQQQQVQQGWSAQRGRSRDGVEPLADDDPSQLRTVRTRCIVHSMQMKRLWTVEWKQQAMEPLEQRQQQGKEPRERKRQQAKRNARAAWRGQETWTTSPPDAMRLLLLVCELLIYIHKVQSTHSFAALLLVHRHAPLVARERYIRTQHRAGHTRNTPYSTHACTPHHTTHTHTRLGLTTLGSLAFVAPKCQQQRRIAETGGKRAGSCSGLLRRTRADLTPAHSRAGSSTRGGEKGGSTHGCTAG